jgi:hypothetical protein
MATNVKGNSESQTKSELKAKKPMLKRTEKASPQARRQAAAILEVLAGMRRPAEAAQVLGTSLPRYYQLERRALQGLVTACEPAVRGPGIDLSRRIAVLERENRKLMQECDRRQALVRNVERSLGLAPTSLVKPPSKDQAEKSASTGKRRRSRRPAVRAMKALSRLPPEEAVEFTEASA